MNPRVFRVVLADDVPALRRLFRIALEQSHRFQIVGEAGNGSEAIQASQQLQPDLVLLDLSMPQMDGLEALPLIIEVAPNARVVILSGFNESRMGPVAVRLGAAGYLEKGLDPPTLVRAVLGIVEPPQQAPAGMNVRATVGAPQRILIVGRDAELATTVQRAIDHLKPGSVLQVVEDASEAVDVMRGNAPDALVVDLTSSTTAGALTSLLAVDPYVAVVAFVDDPKGPLAALAHRLGVEDCLPRSRIDPDMVARSLLYATERRRGQEALRSAREKADELDRMRELEKMKTEFFNVAAHELGTPLTPIKLQLHLLRGAEENFTEPQRRSFEILSRNVDRMGRLSQDLLDVARLQAGHMSIQREGIRLDRIVRETVEAFEPVAMAQGVQLEAPPCPPAWVDVDAKRIGQVLYNLTSNAIKFTRAGGRVTVEVVATADECITFVHDNGVGLSRDQISRLFRPFSQVQGSLQPAGIGTGLGLYVSKGIIEVHGGRIWCESGGSGQGSTFAFALPLGKPPGARAEPAPARAPAPSSRAEATFSPLPPAPMKGGRNP